MENKNMMEFIEILRDHPQRAFDYIASGYWHFSKEELADITKELLWSIYASALTESMTMDNHDCILYRVAEELEETYTD